MFIYEAHNGQKTGHTKYLLLQQQTVSCCALHRLVLSSNILIKLSSVHTSAINYTEGIAPPDDDDGDCCTAGRMKNEIKEKHSMR